MDKRQRRLNIAVTFIFFAVAIMLGASVYYKSYLRLAESAVDFWSCLKHYLYFVLHRPIDLDVTIGNKSQVMEWLINWPETWALFKTKTEQYGTLLVDETNATGWLLAELSKMERASKILIMCFPLIAGVIMAIIMLYRKPNTKHNKDTRPLKRFKKLSNTVYQPFKQFAIGYKEYLTYHPNLVYLYIIIWAFNLNFGAILLSALGYYFYFASSYQLGGLYMQAVKLIMDLQVLFLRFPWYLFLPYIWKVFCRWRERIADARLRHMEAKNCGFIKELPIVTLTCGSMGKRKTTAITDMALSQAVMFRQEAYQRLVAIDMMFPFFPWISFEMALRRCMEYHTVYNLATAREWVRKKEQRYRRRQDNVEQLYGYDTARYGMSYDNNLKTLSLFDALEIYAQLYFIYVVQSSLLVSNYAIREDSVLQDGGNFPLWYNNFFPKRRLRKSRYAHILDFDTLRLGKKMIEDNPNIGSFEFGTVVISEVGKERGNMLELKEIKKGDDKANQKNDDFNLWLKMCRHSATVDNYPFIKVFADEQRAASWGADARDLCDVITITDTSPNGLALPFFVLEDMLCDWSYNGFGRLYEKMRFRRGDNTLLVYLLKSVVSWLYKYKKRIENRFGYSTLSIEKERGTMDSKPERKKYYLLHQKIYAERFATDAFGDFFAEMAKKTNVGLNDYPSYAGTKATIDELHQQHSYFIEGIYSDPSDED
ncbi:MAG: hypothetical protein II896_02545 [Clostridia bacterium]|nr:hypothetical protein [Clostridia bacterium]